MHKESFRKTVNNYAKNGIPFLFIADFNLKNPQVFKLDALKENGVFYAFAEGTNTPKNELTNVDLTFHTILPKPSTYAKKFQNVKEKIQKGNTYLLNLTCKNKIEFNAKKVSLKTIYNQVKAKYKLLYKDEFVCFSPETFIKIEDHTICTFPMKGTIDATVKDAAKKLKNDKKESREHNTIVDLLRNDLALVATDIQVAKFKYLDTIKTQNGAILQMSSKITGKLPKNWQSHLGDILLKLLPAGSVTGAPKQKTVKLIKQIETNNRQFYTGVFGVFDGKNVDSAVLIRFIEKENGAFYYKSGGGITYLSDLQAEYNELKQKIYIPTE